MQNVLFREVGIVDPAGAHHGEQVDLRIQDGEIQDIAAAGSLHSQDGELLQTGGYVAPGFVDMRCYLNDPGEEWKEDLRSLASAGAAGGFTRLLTMPNTHPVMDNAAMIEALLARSQSLPIHIHPAGALSKGLKGEDLAEVYDMKRAGALAFGDGYLPINRSGLFLRGLQYLSSFDGLLMDLPLDSSLDGKGGVAETPFTASLGLQGSPVLAEELRISRNLRLLEYFPGRLHLGPLTSAAVLPDMQKAKERFAQLSLSTSASYLAFDDHSLEGFDPNYKLYPPLREQNDREALVNAVGNGLIDVITSSHRPQSVDERRVEFMVAEPGAVALEACFSLAWTALRKNGIPIEVLVQALSHNPRRILGLPGLHLEKGQVAELSYFDPDADWTPQKADFHSKGVNNPCIGLSLKGRIKGVYSKGFLRLN